MIAVIDYGAGNIFSVKNALDFLGMENRLTSSAKDIESADAVILPGVGAFPKAMDMLEKSGLIETIQIQARKKPFLGICLGMQLLFDKGYEFEVCDGLGLIEGKVKKMEEPELIIPHMGWNKLEILNDEFKTKRQRNPIDSIRSRIKSPLSIYEKLKRRNYPVSIQSIADNLNDVAGIRVVCPFISDIYDVARMLISQDDVEVMEVKDYIKNPKPNGYRSLHYVVIIPIFLSSGKEYMKVEVQIRTIAMNFWASLEHQMHYKQFDNDDMPEIVKQLTECAENIYQTDVRMQEIREDIHKFNE